MVDQLLNIIGSISEIIAGDENYDSAMSKIVGLLADRLEVDVCSIYLHSRMTEELVLAATKGLATESVGKVRMGVRDGLVGACFTGKESINLANPQSDPRFKYFSCTGEEKFKSFLAVPLLVGGAAMGVLVMQRVKSKAFPAPVVDMTRSLGTQLANLVANKNLIDMLSGRLELGVSAQTAVGEGQLMLRGVAANEGTAIGRAFVFEPDTTLDQMEHATCVDAQAELALMDKAVALTKEKTILLEKKAMTLVSEIDASIFNTHLMLLEDMSLMSMIRGEIQKESHTLEFSVFLAYKKFEKRFMAIPDEVFRERIMDLKDVLIRLLETVALLRAGKSSSDDEPLMELETNQILVAKELLPSDLIRIQIDNVAAIVLEKGGATAHISILAKALNIPAVFAIRDITAMVSSGEELIVDCHSQVVYVRPTRQTKDHYREMALETHAPETKADRKTHATACKTKLLLRANISLLCETSLVAKYGACGIGLYRTEFMYMVRDHLPPEEKQVSIFSSIVKSAGRHETTIRALDIGGDKPLPYIKQLKEDNPALGARGVRFLLARPDILKPHLRAILQAGVCGKIRILFPMITTADEIASLRRILLQIESDLDSEGVQRAKDYKIGSMIEVPAAVFGLNRILDEVDFVSVGSNDLLQYVFAIDRTNASVADTNALFHPVFLSVLKRIADTVNARHGKSLGICGEMTSNPAAAIYLLGAGFTDLSMPPRQIPVIHRLAAAFTVQECSSLLTKALAADSKEDARQIALDALRSKGLDDLTTTPQPTAPEE